MRTFTGMEISFVDWMIIGVPAALVLIPFGWLLLMLMFPPEIRELPMTRDDIRNQLKGLGRLSRQELGTILIFAVVISLWVFNPLIARLTGAGWTAHQLRGHTGASCSSCRRLTSIRKRPPRPSWDSIIPIMASLGLGMMTNTRAAKWLAVVLLGGITR